MADDFSPGDDAMCIMDYDPVSKLQLHGLQKFNVYKVTEVQWMECSNEFQEEFGLIYESYLEIRVAGAPAPFNFWGWAARFFKRVDPLPPEEEDTDTNVNNRIPEYV